MGERKVLNKYYPPDFDPSKIPKKKRAKNDQVKVRMMLPMSIRCNTCGEYLYRGKKFNSRKETVTGEEYLGIKIFRFYIKCTRCSAELTIKTDPKNSDYQCEFGASRNFEPWRENAKVVEEAKDKREQEEMGDAMKALENRTTDSKVEMDILDALDEIRSLNARQSKMDPLEVLLAKQLEQDADEKRLDEEDEALVQSVFGDNLKRIEETAKAEQINNSLLERLKEEPILTTKKVKTETTAVPKIGIQPKVGVQTIGTQPKVGVQLKTVPKKDATIQKIGEKKESTGLLSLLGSYADNSSDSDV